MVQCRILCKCEKIKVSCVICNSCSRKRKVLDKTTVFVAHFQGFTDKVGYPHPLHAASQHSLKARCGLRSMGQKQWRGGQFIKEESRHTAKQELAQAAMAISSHDQQVALNPRDFVGERFLH